MRLQSKPLQASKHGVPAHMVRWWALHMAILLRLVRYRQIVPPGPGTHGGPLCIAVL